MTRPGAADDLAMIRARMEELRRERGQVLTDQKGHSVVGSRPIIGAREAKPRITVTGFFRCHSGSSSGRVPLAIPVEACTSIYPAVQNMLLAARALGLGATLTTLYPGVREESRGRVRAPAGSAILRDFADRVSAGSVRSGAPGRSIVFEDRCGQPIGVHRDGEPRRASAHELIPSGLLVPASGSEFGLIGLPIGHGEERN